MSTYLFDLLFLAGNERKWTLIYADFWAKKSPAHDKSKPDYSIVAGMEGVEPSHTEPETAVLPLDDIPT